MGRIGVTYEQFSEAADQVLLTGQFPTIEKVRSILGIGSNTTLNSYINRWKDEFIKNHLAGTKTTALPDPLQRAITEIWESLRSESKAENDRLQMEAETAVKQAQEDKAAAEQQAKVLQAQISKQNLEINHLQSDLKLKTDEWKTEREQRIQYETQVTESEKNLQNLREEMDKRIVALARSHQEAFDQFKHQYEANEKKYQKEIDELKSLIEDQRQKNAFELDKLRTEKNKIEKLQAKLEMDLSQQVKQHQAIKKRAEKAELDLHSVQQKHQAQERELITLSAETNQKDKLMDNLNINLQKWIQKYEEAKEQIGQLKALLAKQDNQ